jgi:hypothetical protein
MRVPPRPDPTLKVEQPKTSVTLEEADLDPLRLEEWLFSVPSQTEFQRISPCDCPVAVYVRQLLQKRFPSAYFMVTVNSARLQILSDGGLWYADFSLILINFIKRVDAGGYTQITAQDALACLQNARKELADAVSRND